MIIRHHLDLSCRCPVNGRLDSYTIMVEADRLVLVEDIEAAAAGWLGKPVYQEDLARQLADHLGCRVTVEGRHGCVRTVVEAP